MLIIGEGKMDVRGQMTGDEGRGNCGLQINIDWLKNKNVKIRRCDDLRIVTLQL
jgi:hypothetical protein